MLVYRVFPYLASAPAGSPGHPTYEHPQGKGRVDNPSHYYVWYVGRDATSAVGEVLGNHDIWDDGIFDFPLLPGSKRALGIYRIDDNTPVLNLDHAFALHERGMRPTQVVERNRPATQSWALRIFNERDDHGDRLWSGVQWWSFHRPHWCAMGLWGVTPSFQSVEPLHRNHPAVRDAALSLSRVFV